MFFKDLLALKKMIIIKATPPKALVIRINLVFLAFFLTIYAILLLRPSSSSFYENAVFRVRCSLSECRHHHKVENRYKMKAVLENKAQDKEKLLKIERPSFLNDLGSKGMKIGVINMEEEDLSEWGTTHGEIIQIHFDRVSSLFKWEDLYPEWIDEEEEMDGPSCPEIPMPDFNKYKNMDIIVTKLPCKYPEQGWNREVFRLQVHLVAANLGTKNGKVKMVFLSKCRPMLEFFGCDEMVKREGEWWLFEPNMRRLERKLSMPAGSCQLALPLWDKGVDNIYNLTNTHPKKTTKRQNYAYVTVLHSSEVYVCGAIALAQSLLSTGTEHDLILLLDTSISVSKQVALQNSGWKIRVITRIRNPKSEKDSYNEYNYSKFRLWQLTEYDKIVFVDADIVVLRNLDVLLHFPQISATGNDGAIFNSGVMVIEPSNCTFNLLMSHINDVVSYNGGDQGFLNEIFVAWHRLPRRVNFLKNLWSNLSREKNLKDNLFGSDPPKLYSIHYLGIKPWMCYRDYDCNWDLEEQRVYASDVAHRRWWMVHDSMDAGLQKECGLAKQRIIELEWDRKLAKEKGMSGEHWRINITDPRQFV